MMEAIEDRQIAKDYFFWLCSKVLEAVDTDHPRSYTYVCDRMNSMTFNDNVPNDRNRSADATQLRHDFIQEHWNGYGPLEVADLLYPSATVLEVLVSLAQRANHSWELGVMGWFGKFMQNLKLTCFSDPEIEAGDVERIGRILSKFNERRYTHNGRGGLFPLRGDWGDQREEELWYQLSHYIEENRR